MIRQVMVGFTVSVLIFGSSACKDKKKGSKLERCLRICDKIEGERKAKCSGPGEARCKEQAARAKEGCAAICKTAMGKKAMGKKAPKGSGNVEADCDKGNGRACVKAASKYFKGAGRDDKKAYAFMEKGCKAGEAFACEMQAKMIRSGRGVARDPAKVQALLSRACDAGSAGACTSLGLKALGTDKAKGVKLLTKACKGDDKLGCMALGALYLHGNGVPKDTAKAKKLLQKSCRLGQQSACKKVKTL